MKKNIFFSEIIWSLIKEVEIYDTQNNKLCSKHNPIYYRKKKLFEDKVVWNIEPVIRIKDNNTLTYHYRITVLEDDDRSIFRKKLMAKDMIDLMESLASDSEKNGDDKGVYYYRSAIPFIEAYYGIKGENKDDKNN